MLFWRVYRNNIQINSIKIKVKLMKKILLLLLFPSILFSQVEFLEGIKVNQITFDNTEIFEFFKRYPEITGSNKGEKLLIPAIKKYPPGLKEMENIDGFFVLYQTEFDILYNHDVKIIAPTNVEYIEYDLKTKKKKKVNANNDDNDYLRPDNLKERLKQKDYEKYAKKWEKESEKIKEFITKNKFLWMRTKQGTITIYDEMENMWFIITNKWQAFNISEKRIELLLEQIKKYYIAGNLLIRYNKKQVSPIGIKPKGK